MSDLPRTLLLLPWVAYVWLRAVVWLLIARVTGHDPEWWP